VVDRRREAEVAALRATEHQIDLNNRVADHVIYQIQSLAEVTNAVLSRLYKSAIDRFGSEMPAAQIRRIVDAVVVKEAMARRDQETRARLVRRRT
jgi:hypothetical protein